jgi:N-acyl-D-amino-acid deacylase
MTGGAMTAVHELVIHGGRVVDPANGLDGRYNIAIDGGKISAVSTTTLAGQRSIDASGLVVSPGFIDIHSHVDGLQRAGAINARMGVTTVVAGNCGSTCAAEGLDVKAFLDRVDGDFPVNQAFLTGAGDIRKAAGVDPYKAASAEQLRAMRPIAEKALDGGAIGISFGIEYAPGTTAAELELLGNIAREQDVICPVHIRCGGPYIPMLKSGAPAGISEVVGAAMRTGARFHISHIGGQIGIRVKPPTALLDKGLALVEAARTAGLDITSDMHPYAAGGTWISAALLDIFQKGFPIPWIIRKAVHLEIGMIEVGTGPYAGTRLTRKLLRQIRQEAPDTLVVLHFFDLDLIEQVLAKPWVSFISDGDFDWSSGAPSHPRCSGTYPRFIQWLVRERRLMDLPQALARMTSLPASQFRLNHKGQLGIGADADITIFDPDTIADLASYAQPDTAPAGIHHVLVNGVPVLADGTMTGLKPGRAIRF